MKLCDKCFQSGEYKPGPHVVKIGVEDFDLCESCKEEIRNSILEKPVARKKAKSRPNRGAKTTQRKAS